MANNFQNLQNNLFSRRFGGTVKGVVDPYISGYFFGFFVSIPEEAIKNNLGNSLGGNVNIRKLLSSGILSVTVPTATLNKTTYDALGGLKWHAPTNIDIGDTCTVKYAEMSGLPYFKVYHAWFNAIRDYRTGASNLIGDGYTKSKYACDFIYFSTKPDAQTVEFAIYMTGMFPSKDPFDLYGGDITAVDKVEYEQEFSVDYVWVNDDWVIKKAESIVDLIKPNIDSIKKAEIGGPSE